MTILIVFLTLFTYIHEDADSLIVINDSLIISGNHHYNQQIKIQNSRLTIRKYMPAYDTTGWLYFSAPLIQFQNNNVSGAAMGYSGGTNSFPNGQGPGGGNAGSTSGGGGGGGAYGGNGGNGGGIPGGGGTAYGVSSDTIISMGSGGGAGRLGGVEGLGGAGGACLTIHSNNIIIDSLSVSCDGENGADASIVAGGAGSGGGIIIRSYNCTLHNTTIHASGGNGGACDGYGGGGGGGGRVKIFYSSLIDTINLSISVDPGQGGSGGWENGYPGSAGTVYFGYDVSICESIRRLAVTNHHTTIINGCLEYSVDCPPTNIEIIDITGRVQVKRRLYHKNNHISLNHLTSGIYFVRQEGIIRKSFIIIK
jgi:hypothetical protein